MEKIISMERFVGRYGSRGTQFTYKSALRKFLQCIGVDSFETYFNDGRDYEEDIEEFLSKLNGSPPKTIRLYLTAVKSYFKRNKIKFEDDFWEELTRRIKGSRARTMDRIPTIEELRQILTHTDAKGKALFLMLASSGMRIGEALSIKINDINLDKDPVEIRIGGEFTKTGDPRFTFINTEAKQVLVEWLKIRKQYLVSACGKSRYNKNPNDDRLFPFDSSTAWHIWTKALRKANLEEFDPSTNRRTIHIHVLRKFFRTRASLHMPREMVEALIGHSEGLDEVYLKYSKDDLIENYKKCEKELLIFTDQDTIKEYTSHLEEKQDSMNVTIANQSQTIGIMKQQHESEIQKLQNYSTHSFDRIKDLEHRIQDMVHAREQELDTAERLDKETKEYTKKFAKENPEKYEKVLELVKTLKELGLKVA